MILPHKSYFLNAFTPILHLFEYFKAGIPAFSLTLLTFHARPGQHFHTSAAFAVYPARGDAAVYPDSLIIFPISILFVIFYQYTPLTTAFSVYIFMFAVIFNVQ